MTIKLIIGLRNPGSAYEQTRHNAGAWFCQKLVQIYRSSFKTEKKYQGELANITIDNFTCRVFLPLCFMNHSGLAAKSITQFYRIEPEEILIVHDELDLETGRIKLKSGGGHGGHNGLRDLILQLGNENFHRLRIGIGHPGHKSQVHNYVLSPPTNEEKQRVFDAIERGLAAIPILVKENMAKAMTFLNS